MKILVANPPWVVGERQGVRAGSRWPHLKINEEERYMPYPFFLGYCSSLLKKHNFNVKAIDAIAERITYDEFKKKALSFSPDFILSEISTPSLDQDLRILYELKEKTGCKLIVAGPDSNIFTREFMEKHPLIDFVLVGEYDMTSIELFTALKEKKTQDTVKGILYRNKNKVYETKKRELFRDIDTLPWPDREDFPINNYHDCPGGIPEPSAQMWASRGCPYQCVFCAWPQIMYGGSSYRVRNVIDVVDEMEFLVKKKGARSIYFDDDTFNIGKKRMLDFAAELKKRKLIVPWAFMGRADLSDKETLQALKEVGLYAVKYGLESGVQELVDTSNKNLDLKKAISNILITKELGIKVHLTFTFGLPGETKETIRKTIKLALFLDSDSVQFSMATPFPGTKFYNSMKKEGNIVSYDWKEYDGNTRSVIRTKNLSAEELKKAQDDAYEIWHNHKFLKQRYAQISPFVLFKMCLRQHGLGYTLKKTVNYLKKKRFTHYLTSRKKNKIILEG